MTSVRCPMRECRRRIDLDALPVPPDQPEPQPCLHFIAGWGGRLGGMAEAVMWGLDRNREFNIRNLRPREVRGARIDEVRPSLEAAARQFAHAEETEDGGALFGDVHERNQVAFAFGQLIFGPDPSVPPRAR